MANLIVAFIRHGDYNQIKGAPSAHQAFNLNNEGEQQSLLQAKQFLQLANDENWQVDPIFDCSHLLRAWQTADIYKSVLQPVIGQSIVIESFTCLAERSVGTSMANLTVKQINQIVELDPRYDTLPNNWKSDSHYCLPFEGAESLMMSGKRVAQHVTSRIERFDNDDQVDKTVVKLFFGHGAAFRHAAHYLGAMEFNDIAKLSMYHAQPVMFEVDNKGNWLKGKGNWKIRNVNSEYKD